MPQVQLPGPLHYIGAKLSRADEQIELVKQQIANFLATQGQNYRITKELQADGTRYSFRVSGNIRLPAPIPILIGEIIHHFRACFDHLVWALVVHKGEKPHNGLQFPTATTEKKFDLAVENGMIRGVSEGAAEFIRSKQPYTIEKPHDHLLSIIHHLDVIDKHRELVTVAAGGTMGPELVFKHSEGEIVITHLSMPTLVPIDEQEREFFYVTFEPPQTKFDADLGRHPSRMPRRGWRRTPSRR